MVSKISFTVIAGFCSFNFATHLKSRPFPLKSTRGRYVPRFGPVPGVKHLLLPLVNAQLRHHPAFQGGGRKRTLFNLSLRYQLTRGLQIDCLFGVTSVPWARCCLSLSTGLGTMAQGIYRKGSLWTSVFPAVEKTLKILPPHSQ